jgi:hypothetical protein
VRRMLCQCFITVTEYKFLSHLLLSLCFEAGDFAFLYLQFCFLNGFRMYTEAFISVVGFE